MANIFVDGSGWNGIVSKYCVVIRFAIEHLKDKVLTYVVMTELTNNEAEYFAIIEGLKLAESGDRIFTDSQLVVNQIKGKFKVNYEHLMKLRDVARKLWNSNEVEINWLRRKDNLAGKVLDRMNRNVRET